jgi:hypothetical protein
VFHQENEQFIRWMENLENISQKILFDNRQQWFETELELDDIENSFTSPMKIYKSGKSYIVKTTIASRLGKPAVKIYDEDENTILFDQLKENANVMVILEVQGIRCSARSFQIDIELKQMMVLKSEDLFNTCILKKKTNSSAIPTEYLPIEESAQITQPFSLMNSQQNHIESKLLKELPDEEHANETDNLGKMEERPLEVEQENTDSESANAITCDNDLQESDEDKIQKITTIPENQIVLETNELCEVDFNLEEMPETDVISIKQRKEVYYEMYKDARQKAKVARDLALSAYLEAKRIKNTYMLDDIINSSDEEDEDVNEDNEYAEA